MAGIENCITAINCFHIIVIMVKMYVCISLRADWWSDMITKEMTSVGCECVEAMRVCRCRCVYFLSICSIHSFLSISHLSTLSSVCVTDSMCFTCVYVPFYRTFPSNGFILRYKGANKYKETGKRPTCKLCIIPYSVQLDIFS